MLKGAIFSEEHKKKISLALKGRKLSQKTRDKMSKFKKGMIRLNPSGENAFHWKGGKPNCLDCGKLLTTYRRKRCRLCNGKSKRGQGHYNWKGGNYHLERVRFHDTMQKQVFERDNYTCQMCNIKGGKLQVDHIQSWAEYVELRFNMDNCRTLCMDCHYFITFGKKKPENIKTWGHNFRRRDLK